MASEGSPPTGTARLVGDLVVIAIVVAFAVGFFLGAVAQRCGGI